MPRSTAYRGCVPSWRGWLRSNGRALVRGDIAFGNERVMAEMEALEQRYLFKLRQTAGVKRLIERQWSRRD